MDGIKRFRTVIGGVILVALLGVTIWAVSTRTGDSPASTEELPDLPTIARDRVTEIEIRRPGDEPPVRLARDGETWRIAAPIEATAAEATVSAALDKLTGLEVVGIASRQASQHGNLEVDAAHGVRVIARAGGEQLIDFYVGAARSGNTLIRVEGRDETLVVRGSIKFAFDKAVRDWRDRAIVEVETDAVRSVAFTNTNGSFHFRKSGDAWEQVLEAPEGSPPPAGIERFAATRVRSVVGSLAHLRASDFAAEDVTAQSAGLGEGAARVELVSGEGDAAQTITLRVGNEVSDGQRYVMREGNETIFVVSRFTAQNLVPAASAFQEAEPGAAPPEGDDGHGHGAEGEGAAQIPPEILRQLEAQMRQRRTN